MIQHTSACPMPIGHFKGIPSADFKIHDTLFAPCHTRLRAFAILRKDTDLGSGVRERGKEHQLRRMRLQLTFLTLDRA